MKYHTLKCCSKMAEMNYNEDYGSEFDEQESKRTWKDDELSGIKRKSNVTTGVTSKKFMTEEYSRVEGRNQRFHFLALDAYSRHKKMINDYLLYYGPGIEHFKRDSSRDATDLDVLRKEHRFIWNEDEDSDNSWEQRLAKKYYDRLFKEYCIADLSRYKENKIALRWRIEKEVIEGKGQFICGNKKCQENEGLKSWEVNFSYEEHGEKKNALVKLRLCPECSFKLNFHHQRKLAKQKKKEYKEKEKREKRFRLKKKRKNKRKRDGKDEATDDYSSSSEEEKSEEESKTSYHEKSVSREEKASTSKDDESEDIWKGPAKVQVDKTREEEFEEYFQDMFV